MKFTENEKMRLAELIRQGSSLDDATDMVAKERRKDSTGLGEKASVRLLSHLGAIACAEHLSHNAPNMPVEVRTALFQGATNAEVGGTRHMFAFHPDGRVTVHLYDNGVKQPRYIAAGPIPTIDKQLLFDDGLSRSLSGTCYGEHGLLAACPRPLTDDYRRVLAIVTPIAKTMFPEYKNWELKIKK